MAVPVDDTVRTPDAVKMSGAGVETGVVRAVTKTALDVMREDAAMRQNEVKIGNEVMIKVIVRKKVK